MSALIGALRVTLGLDTAAFEKGATEIEKRSQKLSRTIDGYGKSMSSLGKTLSVAVSVPLAAISASVVGLANDAKELRNAANLAGEGFEDFQRHAYAAKSVGIEFDKLSDILKDTQDKIGDFTTTGGGEMADFFEKIAPKVGVTADMFKDLSGKDALQLYYNSLVKAGVSQKEMVFYMESIADEGAGLIPLLRDNGKAMKELGANAAVISDKDAEGLKKFTDAQTELGNSVQKLKIALANSGLVEFATMVIQKITALAENFANLPPGVQRTAVAFAAIAAAAGPVLTAVGSLVSTFAPFFAVLGTAAAEGGILVAVQAGFAGIAAVLGPILVPLAAVAAAGYVLYENWDKIAPVLEEFWQALKKAVGPEIQTMITTIKTTLTELWNGPLGDMVRKGVSMLGDFAVAYVKAFGPAAITGIKLLVQGLTNFFAMIGDGVRGVRAIFEGDWRTALQSAISIFNRLFGGLPEYVAGIGQRIGAAIRTWVLDKLNAIWDQVMSKIETVKRTFFNLYDAVVGHSYIPDMVDGIAAQMDRLDAEMVDKVKVAAASSKEAFQQLAQEVQPILDRLFPEAARWRSYQQEAKKVAELGKSGKVDTAVTDEAQRRLSLEYYGLPFERDDVSVAPPIDTAALQAQVEKMTGFAWMAKDSIEAANVRIVKSFKEMADETLSALERMTSAIRGGGFLDILGSVIGFGMQLGSIGAFGKGIQASINRVPAYANGTSFAAGGLALVGERGPELVNLRRGAQVIPNHALGGSARVEIVPSPYFDTRVDGRVAMAGPVIADAGGKMGAARVKQSQAWRLG